MHDIVRSISYKNGSISSNFIKNRPLKKGLSISVCTFNRPLSLLRFMKSLLNQTIKPDELIIVDSSYENETERIFDINFLNRINFDVHYFRVTGKLRGLTVQRNFAIKNLSFDLNCFFDDDIILFGDTLETLVMHLRSNNDLIASGCRINPNNGNYLLPMRWKIRKILGLWGEEDIGYLSYAGMAIPQSLFGDFSGIKYVDIVPGGATCWRTSILKENNFNERFMGYGQAEDIEYSLRTKRLGKKVIVGSAKVIHLHDKDGRPNSYSYGKQCSLGFFYIFCRYSHRKIKNFFGFILWQLLDLFYLFFCGIKEPKKFQEFIGRFMGLVEFIINSLVDKKKTSI